MRDKNTYFQSPNITFYAQRSDNEDNILNLLNYVTVITYTGAVYGIVLYTNSNLPPLWANYLSIVYNPEGSSWNIPYQTILHILHTVHSPYRLTEFF